MSIRLIILGLRRSGTTIFWQTLRQDKRLRCYDEPFNLGLHVLAGLRLPEIKNPEEFLELIDADAADFWNHFITIDKTDELCEGLSDKHIDYLNYLDATAEHVIFDSTRCNFKIEALHAHFPDAVLVHLHRSPAANASSHMIPTGKSKLRTRVRRYLNTRDFWTRPSRYDYWQFESIIGANPRAMFASRMREAGLDPEEVYALPAVAKLLAYWRLNHERVEHDGQRLYGADERFHSVDLDSFCTDPQAVVRQIYSSMSIPEPTLDYSRVHRSKGAYDPDSPNWQKYLDAVGLPER